VELELLPRDKLELPGDEDERTVQVPSTALPEPTLAVIVPAAVLADTRAEVEKSPALSRTTVRTVLGERSAQQQQQQQQQQQRVRVAQAKAEGGEATACQTQLRDILDVLLWACAILAVVGMVTVFYQLTVRGHAHRLGFAVRALISVSVSLSLSLSLVMVSLIGGLLTVLALRVPRWCACGCFSSL
jgi:hypothetical protein